MLESVQGQRHSDMPLLYSPCSEHFRELAKFIIRGFFLCTIQFLLVVVFKKGKV